MTNVALLCLAVQKFTEVFSDEQVHKSKTSVKKQGTTRRGQLNWHIDPSYRIKEPQLQRKIINGKER